jgi:hypothetical protein
MKTPLLVAPVGTSHTGCQRRDLPAASRDTAQAVTLDEAIAWNLKDLGYDG